MNISLYPHQVKAVRSLKTGSILCGGVGSGKSRTSLAYYMSEVCKADIPLDFDGEFGDMKCPKDLYIITTPRKRDEREWDRELLLFYLSKEPNGKYPVSVTIDSWNLISRYTNVENGFFIFDEQKVVGAGAWVKSFLKIAKNNDWILLSATPGDVWMDYVPVFIANGFFKNRSEFIRNHVIYARYSKYPKIERYVGTNWLESLRKQILVPMPYDSKKNVEQHIVRIPHDATKEKEIDKNRWNIYTNEPIKDAYEKFALLRRLSNSDPFRISAVREILRERKRAIIFYNFNYELDILRALQGEFTVSEWNGHVHQPVPETEKWAYLVQYTSGAEAWNCIRTDTIIFYSLNYSYRVMRQAAGRIDRLDSPFQTLHYYAIVSSCIIDKLIVRALNNKQDFNERDYIHS